MPLIIKETAKFGIDRSQHLDIDDMTALLSEKTLSEGCRIYSQDERAMALQEINPARIRFESMRHKNELNLISARNILTRVNNAGRIPLDIQIFKQIFLNPEIELPHAWRYLAGSSLIRRIYCYGTIFQNRRNEFFVAGWEWEGSPETGRWKKPLTVPLEDKHLNYPAVVLS